MAHCRLCCGPNNQHSSILIERKYTRPVLYTDCKAHVLSCFSARPCSSTAQGHSNHWTRPPCCPVTMAIILKRIDLTNYSLKHDFSLSIFNTLINFNLLRLDTWKCLHWSLSIQTVKFSSLKKLLFSPRSYCSLHDSWWFVAKDGLLYAKPQMLPSSQQPSAPDWLYY